MGEILAISPAAERALERAREAGPRTLPQWQRDAIAVRLAAIRACERACARGLARPQALAAAAAECGRSVSTVRRWRDAWERGGEVALASAHQGRKRASQAWDARAIALVQLPSRMNSGEIAASLRSEGFGGVTPAQVRRFRKTLPSNYDETSPRKLGAHHYRLNETPYVVRDFGHVPVGYLYEMDGHTCDFYCAHPATGNHFRPELTFLLDVRSRYIVDFWIGGFENSRDLRWLLSRAFVGHDHVCHELHIDPGAGTAKTFCDLVSGFGAKLGFAVHFALPGNARGKGLVEGEYHIFEGRFGKMMPTYLHDRTDDAMRLFSAKWRRGEVERMSVAALCDLIASRYVRQRNEEPRAALGGQSPAELWATLRRNPVIAPLSVICRPREPRTVANGRVRIHKRCYELPAPWRAQYEDREVLVEYDEWHDREVWIFDAAGRHICEAPLLSKRPGIPESRVAERLAATAAGQRKRLALKIAEAEARARISHSPAQILESLDAPALPAPASDAETVLGAGTSFARPAPRAPAAPSAPSAEARALVERLDDEPETESAAERFARALALEAATEIDAADAQWLAVYRTSAEYHAHRLLAEEFFSGSIGSEIENLPHL